MGRSDLFFENASSRGPLDHGTCPDMDSQFGEMARGFELGHVEVIWDQETAYLRMGNDVIAQTAEVDLGKKSGPNIKRFPYARILIKNPFRAKGHETTAMGVRNAVVVINRVPHAVMLDTQGNRGFVVRELANSSSLMRLLEQIRISQLTDRSSHS